MSDTVTYDTIITVEDLRFGKFLAVNFVINGDEKQGFDIKEGSMNFLYMKELSFSPSLEKGRLESPRLFHCLNNWEEIPSKNGEEKQGFDIKEGSMNFLYVEELSFSPSLEKVRLESPSLFHFLNNWEEIPSKNKLYNDNGAGKWGSFYCF